MSEPLKTTDLNNTELLRPLRGRILRARIVMVWERLCRCFWPVFVVALVACAVWMLRGFGDAFIWGALIVACGAVWFLIRVVRAFQWPQLAQVYARLDDGVAGTPVRALADELALGRGDVNAEGLWQTHLSRMADRAAFTTTPHPHVRLAGDDPYALRLLAILALGVAALFATTSNGYLDGDGGGNAVAMNTGPSFEVWAKPPLYTGLPTIYLNDVEQGEPISVAAGSEFLLRSYGDVEIVENLSVLGNTVFPDDGAALAEARFVMVQSGALTLRDGEGAALSWDISVLSDLPPMIDITGEMTRDLKGAMQLPFRASDDYGVTGGALKITLDLAAVDRRHGLALPPEPTPDLRGELPLPFNTSTADFDGVVEEDFAKHVWAGMPVVVELSATDAAQNTGTTIPFSQELARKRFFDPLAAALVNVRRELLWNRENAERATYLLRAITYKPEGTFRDNQAYEMSRDAIGKLETYGQVSLGDAAREEITELLWAAALIIEDGDLDDAAEQLRRAQERLNEAMENGATDEEIAQLMEALREATKNYMDELAENAPQQDAPQSGQQGETITQDEIQEMMDEIQRLMEEGRMDEAQELLQELQEMLENMEIVKQSGQGGEGESTQDQMQDMLEDQQELADETFQELQEQFNQQQQGEGNQQQSPSNQESGENGQQQDGQTGQQDGDQQQGGEQGQNQGDNGDATGGDAGNEGEVGNGQSGAGANDLAERQKALRDMLDRQRRNLPNDGSDASKEAEGALNDADRQMGDAQESLEKRDFGRALDQQSDALESLRRGMRALRGQEQAQGQQEGDQNGSSQSASNDPLGRATGQDQPGQGLSDDETNKGLDKANRRRQYENLLNELKGRAQDRTRPEYELEYLERLLDRF